MCSVWYWTLFNTKKEIIAALNEVLEKHDIKTIERNEEKSFIGPPIMESLVKLRNVDETVAGKITIEYRKRYIEKYLSKSNEYSGCREILTALIKDGQYYFAIATMKTEQIRPKIQQKYQEYKKLYNDICNYLI